MMSNISFYSYGDLIYDRNKFRISDKVGINRFDTPNALFYKLVFYFSDESGLLGLDGINGFNDDVTKGLNGIDVKKDRIKNTAYNFLLLNDELERAEMLKNFLILLSEINTNSPWYFQEISGIDSALERKIFSEGELKIEDKPGQFTIKCLNDAYDDRIGTLLDLYRASCFSYQNKKEIVPRNLRKFNMGILLFSAPIRGKGGKSGDPNNRIKIPSLGDRNLYIPSTKLIEFRNCEFDYNSSKSPFGTLNTSEAPFSPEYTITINFDDCYESRYNEIMQEIITDFINIDINKERTNDFNDILLRGKAIDFDVFKANLNDDETGKDYWVEVQSIDKMDKNSPYSVERYDPFKIEKISLDYKLDPPPIDIEKVLKTENKVNNENKGIGSINENYYGKGPLTSAINDTKDKIKAFTELPNFNLNENIHDKGRVTKYGEFEYLNRMSGTDGFVGSVLQQGVGIGVKTLRDEVSKLYLGNLYEMSVSNVLDITKRALSGNVAGTIGAVKNLSPKSSSKFPEPIEELYSDTKQRKLGFNPITEELYSDIQQRKLGFNPITEELYSDTQQRELGFNPITDEIRTDPTQREITSSEPLEKLPGYVNKRTNLLNKINKKSSIRNTL